MEQSGEHCFRERVVMRRIGMPLTVTLAGFVLLVLCRGRSSWLSVIGIPMYLIGLLYLSVQTVGYTILRQWPTALWVGLSVVLCLVPGCVMVWGVLSLAQALQSEDGFAKDLEIPANVQAADPLPEPIHT
ncbi:MAG TPA: hypothetical protein PKH24_20570 [Sedimentisphaerales bacterium]|nr:hypothetical protein [Sedimentisphaerales bacterium]HNU31584.1 hypothetical protein [Sedimentisphaerales bacterium]